MRDYSSGDTYQSEKTEESKASGTDGRDMWSLQKRIRTDICILRVQRRVRQENAKETQNKTLTNLD